MRSPGHRLGLAVNRPDRLRKRKRRVSLGPQSCGGRSSCPVPVSMPGASLTYELTAVPAGASHYSLQGAWHREGHSSGLKRAACEGGRREERGAKNVTAPLTACDLRSFDFAQPAGGEQGAQILFLNLKYISPRKSPFLHSEKSIEVKNRVLSQYSSESGLKEEK